MSAPARNSRADDVGEQLRLAESLCAERGRRLTPIRRKVLELLLTHGRSLKAYELLDAMRAVHPGAAPPRSTARWTSSWTKGSFTVLTRSMPGRPATMRPALRTTC
ncbi:putative glucose-6-phosphate isomerase [Bordetella holmesii 41130]|nr:putative glucose-6-phosphate isomerase [Bordetella holmesii 41130]